MFVYQFFEEIHINQVLNVHDEKSVMYVKIFLKKVFVIVFFTLIFFNSKPLLKN